MNSEFYVATHCLLLLACDPKSVMTSGKIAGQLSVHPVRVRKALGMLKKNGFIDSREGLNGGFTLAMEPSKITLEQIYTLTEPNVLKFRCKPSEGSCCPVNSNIGGILVSVFTKAENMLLDQLKNYSLKSMMDEIYSLSPKPCDCSRKTGLETAGNNLNN